MTTLATDLGEKLADDARAGVPDYWVVPFDQPLAVPGTSGTITVA